MVNKVQIESARDIIDGFDSGSEAEWPQRCATGQILVRNDEGKVIETDLYFSASMTEDGKFDTEANNPLVIHHAPGGHPQHEFMICQVRDRGTNRRIRPWIAKIFSALSARFFDSRTPSKEETPEEATAGLGGPTGEDVPT